MQYKQKRQTMLRNPWNGMFVHHCCCPKHTMWHQHSKKEKHKCKTCWQHHCRYPRSTTWQCVPHSKNCSDMHPILFDHPKDANHDNVHLKGRIAVLLCALAFHCTSQRSSPLNCSNHNDLCLNGRIAVLLCALVFYYTSWRSSPLNCCNHDNMHLNGRIAVLHCALVFHCTRWTSSPLNCCNHDDVCLNGRIAVLLCALVFYYTRWRSYPIQLRQSWQCVPQHTRIAVLLCIFVSLNKSSPIELLQNERELPQKKLNGNCCLILHRNQVVITQTSLQMYCHLACPN